MVLDRVQAGDLHEDEVPGADADLAADGLAVPGRLREGARVDPVVDDLDPARREALLVDQGPPDVLAHRDDPVAAGGGPSD